MMRIDRSLIFVFKAAPIISFFLIIIGFIAGFLPLCSLYILKMIIDYISDSIITSSQIVINHIIFLIVGAGIVAGLTNILSHVSSFLQKAQGLYVSDYVFNLLHNKSLKLDMAFYENPAFYDTLYRAQQEGPYRPQKIVNGLATVFQSFVSICAIAGLFLIVHWGFALILIFAAVPSMAVRFFFSGKMYNWYNIKTEKEREASYLNWLLTGYINAKEIRLFNLGDYFSISFTKIRSSLRKKELKIFGSKTFFEACAAIVSAVLIFGAYGYIAVRTANGYMTIGEMVMFFQALQKGLGFLKTFFSGISELYEDNLFVSYFYKFLDLKSAIHDNENSIPFPDKIQKSIEFSNVTFSYPGATEPVLKNISFKIEKEQLCAIVGENGAGKSTLIKLLARLYDPDQGRILIDEVDLKDYKLKDLRNKIGIMLQDFGKFHFSVKENIRVGDVENQINSLDEIIKASKKGGADGFISDLTDGYDTILGKLFKNSTELSQGEWQKIAISRIFFKNSGIIAFDEPASSLDAESEYEIFNRLGKLIKGKTAIIVSHRFATVRAADKIIVLKNGNVSEEGSHDLLINKNGHYKKWLDLQVLANKV